MQENFYLEFKLLDSIHCWIYITFLVLYYFIIYSKKSCLSERIPLILAPSDKVLCVARDGKPNTNSMIQGICWLMKLKAEV